MLDDELLIEIIKKTLSNGGEYADIFVEQKKQCLINLEDNKIEKINIGSVVGAGIRLIFNGKTVFGYTNDLSSRSLHNIADTLTKAVLTYSDKRAADLNINFKKRYPDKIMPIQISPDTVPIEDKIEIIISSNKTARMFDSSIKQVKVGLIDTNQKVKICSSEGVISEDERIYTTGLIYVIASDNGVIQTGYETVSGLIGYELFEENKMNELALIAATRAVSMLKAKRMEGGRMAVVISSLAGGTMIHEAIGHGLEADLIRQGLSIYKDKKGSLVASSLITVIDDGSLQNKRGSFIFDDEGTLSKRNVLVDKGVLVGFLYDKYNAIMDNVISTGNGRRESYEFKPIPRMTNTFIETGNSINSEIIKSVDNGLFVKKMGGGQVNTVTGDFVFDVQEGYKIINGEICELVRGATLIGNGTCILKSIDMVGSDLGFSIGTCGKDGQGVPVSDALPTIRIPEIVVGGEINK